RESGTISTLMRQTAARHEARRHSCRTADKIRAGGQSQNSQSDRCQRAGGQILNGPIEVAGGNRTVPCADPQGGIFALVGKRTRNTVGYFERAGSRDLNFDHANKGEQRTTQALQLDTAEQTAEQFQALIISNCLSQLGETWG